MTDNSELCDFESQKMRVLIKLLLLPFDYFLVSRSGLFDRAYYLTNNDDLVGTKIDLLLHFLLWGGSEGRNPNASFHSIAYLHYNEDVQRRNINPLVHYLRKGRAEGRHAFSVIATYQDWIWKNEYHAFKTQQNLHPATSPKFIIVFPIAAEEELAIRATIDSVLHQTHLAWELRICGDEAALNSIRKSVDADPRVSLITCSDCVDHAARARYGSEDAAGGFLVFIDASVRLNPMAFQRLAYHISNHPEVLLIYSDEDRIDAIGKRKDPILKSDWNIELLCNYYYLGSFLVIDQAFYASIGGIRAKAGQDYLWDFALRSSKSLDRKEILHVPEILFHTPEREIANLSDTRPDHSRSLLTEHYASKTITFEKTHNGGMKADYRLAELEHTPLASILIPTHARTELLSGLLLSICQKTVYPSFEIVIINNGPPISKDAICQDQMLKGNQLRIINDESPFNFSSMINRACKEASGEGLVMLNDDTTISNEGWLTELLELAFRPENGAVGPLLLYPDQTIQHAGMALVEERAFHVGRNLTCSQLKDKDWHLERRNYLALTGACLAFRREVYEQVGGLDERFAVTWNDVDFCLKIHEAGLLNVFTPHAVILHDEGKTRWKNNSRMEGTDKGETKLMLDRWKQFFDHDPYFSVHFYDEQLNLLIMKQSEIDRLKPSAQQELS